MNKNKLEKLFAFSYTYSIREFLITDVEENFWKIYQAEHEAKDLYTKEVSPMMNQEQFLENLRNTISELSSEGKIVIMSNCICPNFSFDDIEKLSSQSSLEEKREIFTKLDFYIRMNMEKEEKNKQPKQFFKVGIPIPKI